jgi:anaerobic C4-dicarboxylate transporter
LAKIATLPNPPPEISEIIIIPIPLSILGIYYISLFFWLHFKKLDMHSLCS